MNAEAERELLAPVEDVWAFLAEPRHLADWWPGIAAVEPDRRGLAAGARWQLRRSDRPGLLRSARSTSTLLVRRVEEPRLLAWELPAERLEVEIRLDPTTPGRSLARLCVSGPLLLGLRRSVPKRALSRLHALCQTAVTL